VEGDMSFSLSGFHSTNTFKVCIPITIPFSKSVYSLVLLICKKNTNQNSKIDIDVKFLLERDYSYKYIWYYFLALYQVYKINKKIVEKSMQFIKL
jgi:hypothetical protein